MKKLNFWKDLWSVIPVVILTLAGWAVSFHDSVLSPPEGVTLALAGGLLIFLGSILELIVRYTLIKRAGFSGIMETKRLLITDDHQLITDGIFGHIRHPLYLGRILSMNFGIALLFSSLWGAVLLVIAAPCYLLRIRVVNNLYSLIKSSGGLII